MDLSHNSITGREFELNRRGYEPEAVDAHLREIAEAAVEKQARVTELETVVESLQAKVQDADESQEALRLTLKAAAHAKQELLAGAREQAKQMEDAAADKADTVVSQAESRATELVQKANTEAEAIGSGARSHAQGVAKAALAESETLVARIEGLREQLATAEEALQKLSGEAGPNIVEAREALDSALDLARETVENPVGAAAPADPVAEVHQEEPEHVETPAERPIEDHEAPAAEIAAEPAVEHEAPAAEIAAEPAVEHEPNVQEQPQEAAPAETEPAGPEPVAETNGHPEGAPHLEVVAPAETTSDISDKVDKLLEELREVT